MNPVAVIAAVVSGVASALLWTLIGYLTAYELPPFVALFVGGFVGYGAVSFDGHGVPLALCAAAISLFSVLGGKAGGVYVAAHEARDELADQLDLERFETMKDHAPSLCVLPSADYHRDFMIANGYAGSTVSDEELKRFNAVEAPVLRRLYAEQIDAQEWRGLYVETYLEYKMRGNSALRLVLEDIEVADIIFAILAAIVTFGMVTNATAARNEKLYSRR